MMSTFESLVKTMMAARVDAFDARRALDGRARVSRYVARWRVLRDALGAREGRSRDGRIGGGRRATAKRKTSSSSIDGSRWREDYVRLCERDGDDANARRVEALMIELREAFGDDVDAFDGARRLVFALEGAGGDAAVRERRAMTVEGREGYSGLGARVVALEDETREARERSMRATPSVGGLRARDEKRETGDRRAVMRVPTLRLGAVFSARDEDASESELKGSRRRLGLGEGRRRSKRQRAGRLTLGMRRHATTRPTAGCSPRETRRTLCQTIAMWARETVSALGAALDATAPTPRRAGRRGRSSRAGLRASSPRRWRVPDERDILIAAGIGRGEVTMRFAADRRRRPNALKTMVAGERGCELERTRRYDEAVRATGGARCAMLRSHSAALYAITAAVAQGDTTTTPRSAPSRPSRS